jgi:hypothetical protein
MNGSLLSATTQNHWEQTPSIISGLEETGPENPFHKPHTASQTCELLTHSNSGELPIKDSSPDKASGKPQDLLQSSTAVALRI